MACSVLCSIENKKCTGSDAGAFAGADVTCALSIVLPATDEDLAVKSVQSKQKFYFQKFLFKNQNHQSVFDTT